MASKSAQVETHPGPSADSETATGPLPELSNDSVLAAMTSPEARPFRASDALFASGGSTPDGAAGVSDRDTGGSGKGRAGSGSTALGSGGALSHGPRLVSKRGVCRGLFPHRALHESGSVTITVEVTPEGSPLSPHVTAEAPRDEGFAQAARDCVPRLHFEPATDAAGRPIASASKVRLSFVRSL
jgi:protein TonB